MNPARPLSFDEAADALGISPRTFYRWATQPEFPLPIVKVGSIRKIPAAALDFYVTFGRPASAEELRDYVKASAA